MGTLLSFGTRAQREPQAGTGVLQGGQDVPAGRADRACEQGVQAGCSSRACRQGGSGPAVLKGCSSAGSAAEGLAALSNDLSASAPPSGTCCLVGIDLTRVEEEITLSHPRRAGLGLPAWVLALFPFPAGAKCRQGKRNRWRSGKKKKKPCGDDLGLTAMRDAASVRAPVPGHEPQSHWKMCRKEGKGEQSAVGLLCARAPRLSTPRDASRARTGKPPSPSKGFAQPLHAVIPWSYFFFGGK